MSITADPTPSNKTTKSEILVECNSVPNQGIVFSKTPAKLNNIPNDSKAATANKIPKKNKILGISILDKDLCTGLW